MKNAAKHITGRRYARYVFTVVIIAILWSTAQAALNTARLHHYSLSPQAVTFTVTSTGCTREQDFDLLVERDPSDRDATLRVTVIRTKPDWCKSMPQPVTFTKTLPRDHSSSAPVVVTNAVTPAPGKTPKTAGEFLKKNAPAKTMPNSGARK